MKRILLITTILAIAALSCKHSKNIPPPPVPPEPPKVHEAKAIDNTKQEFATVQAIFKKNNQVEISRCSKNGKQYFKAQMNVHDGGEKIYDEMGTQVASCTPMSHTDALCTLEKCEVIYTPTKNIWGHKGVDLWGIAN